MDNKSQIMVDDIVVNYYKNNWNSDFVIVFLHWRGRDGLDWKEYFEPLISKWISFVAIDFPWFWYTQMPKTTRWVPEYSEFILKFLNKLWNTKKIICVWHSFGGRIGFYLAANYPDVFTKLVLLAPWGVENSEASTKKSFIKIAKKIAMLPWLQTIWEHIKNKIWSADYKNAWKMKDIFVKIVNQDLRHLFQKITIPVMLYRWDQDNQILERQINIIKEGISNIKTHIYPGVSHDVHREKVEDILVELTSL